MAIGQTAELLTVLKLQNGLSPGLRTAEGSLRSFNGRLGGVTAGLGHAGGRLKSVASSVLSFTGAFGALGLAGALIGATKSAMTFQQEMELLRTQTGATQGEVTRMSAAVLDLAAKVPLGPEALAQGLYHVESAGYRGAKALEILKTAAQGAATGGADLESVTNALVAAEQSGIKGAGSMKTAMGALNAIVGSGNMRMQDLASAMSSGILPSAKTFGVTLQSIGAALATMTDEGVPAQEAATRLRMTLSLLGAPTSKAAGQLKLIGIDSLDMANKMRGPGGIVDAVGLLRDHMMKAGLIDSQGNPTSQGAQLLSKAFGGGRSSSTIMTLVGNYGLLLKKQEAVNAGAKGFGSAVEAASKTSAWKFGQLRAALDALGVKLGNVLLPIATDIASGIGNWLADPSNEKSLVSGLQTAVSLGRQLAGVLGTVFGGLASAWGAIPGPLQQLLVGGFAVQKASKWLFGSGPLQWITGALRGGAKGGIGGALGAAGATPVYVVNMPPGGLGGGIGGAAGKAGWSMLGLAGAAAGGLAIAGVFKAAVIDPALQKQSDQISSSVAALISNPRTTRQQMMAAIAAAKQGAADIRGQAFGLGGTLWGGNAAQLDKDVSAMQRALMAIPLRSDAQRAMTPDKLKAAVHEGNRDVAARTDVRQMQFAVTMEERRVGTSVARALQMTGAAISGTERSGFAAVVSAVQAVAGAIGGLPAYFGTASQQGRGTGPGGRPAVAPGGAAGAPVGIEKNRHIYIQSSVTPRSNDYASAIQGRYGPTPSRAGAA